MTKIGIFALIIVNLLPFSATTRVKTQEYLKSKFSLNNRVAETKNEFKTADYKFSASPELKGLPEDPNRARAQLAMDVNSGVILEQKNADTKLQVASLTKLMTAYLTLKDLSLDKVITVPTYNLHAGDSVMGINPGEEISIKSLLKGTLIPSGSDAAQALAITDAGSIDAFVIKMNQAASELKLNNTHFANPVGWDDQSNYSTANDIAVLTRVLLNNQTFREIVSIPATSVATTTGRQINLASTNYLLSDNTVFGVKTGTTPGAGECLVTLKKQADREIITVLLDSGDRFGQTKAFFDWINTNFVLK